MMLVDTTVWKVTLPAEAFVADVKLVSDLSTNGSRQVKWVIFPFLTVEAQSLEFFESQLKIQTSSNRCFRFATVVGCCQPVLFKRLVNPNVSSSLKNNDSIDPGRGLVDSVRIL